MLLKGNRLLLAVLYMGYAYSMPLECHKMLPIPEKVTIIGAGLAGLNLAYRLEQQGFTVEIYEAHNRLGGRILTIELDGNITELGGHNLYDGGSAACTLSLIDELGLTVENCTFERYMAQYFDGNDLIDVRDRLKAMLCSPRELWNKLLELEENAFSMEDVLNKLFPEDPLLREMFSIKLADYEGGPAYALSPLVIDSLFKRLLSCMRVSALSSEELAYQFSYMFVKGGNALITERLAERISGNIYLNMPLTKIDREQDGSYNLTFANGETRKTGILVLTMPCSVYGDIDIASNVITQDTLADIKSVRYGSNAKILMPSYGEQLFGPFTNGRMVCYFNQILRTITVYYVNEHGWYTADNVQDHFNHDLKLLRHVYDLPEYIPSVVLAKDAQFEPYQGPVGHSWPEDPYAKGSYSYIGAGQEELLNAIQWSHGELVRTLFAPLNDNTLFFAGEATTINLDICGTIEAAVESGERIARMICKSWHPQYISNSLTRDLFLGILIPKK